MTLTTYCITITILLSMILMTLSSAICWKTNKDREKSSPFECGFSPFNTARIPFSLRFFLIAVIFLIFDVEVVLLLPVPGIMSITSSMIMSSTFWLFMLILTLGLYYEWASGALEWTTFTYI